MINLVKIYLKNWITALKNNAYISKRFIINENFKDNNQETHKYLTEEHIMNIYGTSTYYIVRKLIIIIIIILII